MKFSKLNESEGLEKLDNYLLANSFLGGLEPTQADLKVFSVLKPGLIGPYINISRWFANISSFGPEQKLFPPSAISIEVETEETSEKTEVAFKPPA